MLRRVTVRSLRTGDHQTSRTSTPPINGRIEKVVVEWGPGTSPEAGIAITTGDGEVILNAKANQDKDVFYPRNYNASSGRYSGISVLPDGASPLERYSTDGPLGILFTSSGPSDNITAVSILYETDKPDDAEIRVAQIISQGPVMLEKDGAAAGAVTSTTSGVENPVSSRRPRIRKLLDQAVMKEYDHVLRANKIQEDLTKSESNRQQVRDFIADSVFGQAFDGMTLKESEDIQEYLIKAILGTYPEQRVIDYLIRKGIGSQWQATNIFRTERHELKSKVREFAFRQSDPDGSMLYKWIGPDDHRTTSICKRITERAEGVNLDKLQEIIQDEVEKAKARGELPEDFEVREWTPHFSCRHTFVRSQ